METAISSAAPEEGSANSAQIQSGPELPKPGQPGSPFPVEHFWNRFGLELAGGYSPILDRGEGYYGPGYAVTVGTIYRFNPRWGLLGEGQVLGQHGNFNPPSSCVGGQECGGVASYVFALHLDPIFTLRPDAATSPFVVGGGGYDHLGTHLACAPHSSDCLTTSNDPFVTNVISVNAVGFEFGAGVRRRLFSDRRLEMYVDARYHFIASGSSALGRVSMLPMSAGIRW